MQVEIKGEKINVVTPSGRRIESKDVTMVGVDSIFIPLDPYEQEALEIRWLPEPDPCGEIQVIHHGLAGQPECVHSVIIPEP